MRKPVREMTPEELRRMQLIQAELLQELDRVCRLHGIKYIIASGTLLGAVRYQGFIPWDDDIDVEILREDYEAFLKAARLDLDSRMFFQDHRTDRGYPWLYGKLRMNGTSAVRVGQERLNMHSGVFIDIFPRDPMPNSAACRRLFEGAALLCRKLLYSRVMKDASGSACKRFGWKLLSLIPAAVPFGVERLLRGSVQAEKAVRVRCYGYHGRYETEGYDKRWFTELTELPFEGGTYYAPADWNGYLTFVYGADYMTPPPEAERGVSSPLSSYHF